MTSREPARWSLISISALLAFVLTFGAGTAAAAQGRADDSSRLTVDVSAQRFVAKGGQVVAQGPVVATVQRPDGTTQTLQQSINLRVKPTKNCRILDLHLAKLYLNLLGLQVRTSDINVKITGESKATLGKLFCKLSQGLKLGDKALAKQTAASLNKELGTRSLPVLAFEAPVRPQQQPGTSARLAPATTRGDVPPVPAGSCEVLNLLLGPLHLNLLGLVVDLYGPTTSEPVRVLVTADPNGGALGSSLCQYAGPYTG